MAQRKEQRRVAVGVARLERATRLEAAANGRRVIEEEEPVDRRAFGPSVLKQLCVANGVKLFGRARGGAEVRQLVRVRLVLGNKVPHESKAPAAQQGGEHGAALAPKGLLAVIVLKDIAAVIARADLVVHVERDGKDVFVRGRALVKSVGAAQPV